MDIESTPANFHPKTLNLQKNNNHGNFNNIIDLQFNDHKKKNQYLEDQRLSA
jgi:hypothetical protein